MSFARTVIILVSISIAQTTLLLCSEEYWGKLYKLSENLKCKNKNYVKWNISISKRNIAEYESSANALVIMSRTCESYMNFVGEETITGQSKRVITVNPERAKYLIENRKCINEKGEYQTKLVNNFKCDFKWLEHRSKTTTSCYFSDGVVIANHEDTFTSSLSNMEGCDYSSGYCLTHNGKHVTWNVIENVKRAYLPVGQFNATQIENKLLVPELSMSFNLPEKNPGNTWIDRDFQITGSPAPYQFNFENVNSNNENAIEAIREELVNKFNYLLELIKSPLAQTEYLCNVYNDIYGTERILAKIDPTDYVQWKLNRTDVKAKLVGKLLMVYPCLQIQHYRFINDTNRCYNGFKIEYNLPENDEYIEGYVDPKYNMIMPTAIEIDCHNSTTQYMMVNNTILAQSAHGLHEMRVNLSKVESIDRVKLTGIPMSQDFQNWIYNTSELKHHDISDLILKEMENEINHLTIDKTEKRNVKSDWWELFGIFGQSKFTIIFAIISNVQSIAVWYLIWRYIIVELIISKCVDRTRGRIPVNEGPIDRDGQDDTEV